MGTTLGITQWHKTMQGSAVIDIFLLPAFDLEVALEGLFVRPSGDDTGYYFISAF